MSTQSDDDIEENGPETEDKSLQLCERDESSTGARLAEKRRNKS
jgi:hypothetical protein